MLITERQIKKYEIVKKSHEVIAEKRLEGYVLIFKYSVGLIGLRNQGTMTTTRNPYQERIFKSLDGLANTAKKLGVTKLTFNLD